MDVLLHLRGSRMLRDPNRTLVVLAVLHCCRHKTTGVRNFDRFVLLLGSGTAVG